MVHTLGMNKTPLFITSLTLLSLLLTGCSLSPVKMSKGSNAGDEISALQVSFDNAQLAQVDVLAAGNFEIAGRYLLQAKDEKNKGESPSDVLESVGYSRAYLQLATHESISANSRLKEITKARRQAIKAGARQLPDQLNELDKDLKDLSGRVEKISRLKKASLKSNYFALELEAIRHTQLQKFKKL